MKKFKLSLIVLLFSLFVSSQAFALECKQGNFGSDECWTTANLRVTGENLAQLLPGTVMVYDFVTPVQHGVEPNSADRAAFYVRPSASTDNTYVAGIYQGGTNVESGDRVQLLVRGKGLIRNATTTAISGDRVYASTNGEARSVNQREVGLNYNINASNDQVIAFMLESQTAAGTNDAFITIV